jgi:hypothetical protein
MDSRRLPSCFVRVVPGPEKDGSRPALFSATASRDVRFPDDAVCRVGYNGSMKKAGLLVIALVLLLQPLVFMAGCGGGDQQGFEEEAVNYAIEDILIPELRDSDFIVEWMRKPTSVADDSPEELGLRFWKWEGGALTLITVEEFEDLADQREVGDPRVWIYSQHSITVVEADEAKGEAVVEIGSLYGPLAGSGVRYLLQKDENGWEKVSEQTVWQS